MTRKSRNCPKTFFLHLYTVDLFMKSNIENLWGFNMSLFSVRKHSLFRVVDKDHNTCFGCKLWVILTVLLYMFVHLGSALCKDLNQAFRSSIALIVLHQGSGMLVVWTKPFVGYGVSCSQFQSTNNLIDHWSKTGFTGKECNKSEPLLIQMFPRGWPFRV